MVVMNASKFRAICGVWFEYARWCVAALAITLALVYLLMALLPYFLSVAEWSYERSGKDFKKAAGDTFPYIYVSILGIAVGILGVAAALVAVFVNARNARLEREQRANSEEQARRQQDTQNTLLDTRLSRYYQEQVALRVSHFPSGKEAKPPEDVLDECQKKTDSPQVSSVIYLLNYYEFLSIGILQGNLDETVLKESLRGILCRLVFDMRSVIAHARNENSKAFIYLVTIYDRWVSKVDGNYEWEDGLDLGPTLDQE